MNLEGRWAWQNQYAPTPRVDRAKAAGLKGIIIKYGLREAERAYTEAGIPWATEVYALPSQPDADAQRLADAVDAGAVAAVINAEVEWENERVEPMERLIAMFRARHPTVELYASVDTRGNRLSLRYQQVLRRHIAGWLPMVYPKAFRSTCPPGFVAAAFRDCLDNRAFGGIPVLPTIQTYDGIGAQAVAEQIAECKRRGLTSYQAYTIGHATDQEWAAFCPKEEPMAGTLYVGHKAETPAEIKVALVYADITDNLGHEPDAAYWKAFWAWVAPGAPTPDQPAILFGVKAQDLTRPRPIKIGPIWTGV